MLSPTLLCWSIFVSYHRCHLYLHSFPTRRSSDLFRRAASDGRAGSRPREGWDRRRRRTRGATRRSSAARLSETPRRTRRRDRKSTRLNSSHLVTSYAVFCLKKKNAHLTSTITACT